MSRTTGILSRFRNRKPDRGPEPAAPGTAAEPTFNTVSWWDIGKDDALAPITASAHRRATHNCPNVLVDAAELPSEFDELLGLIGQRLRGLQAQALRRTAADVEFVLQQIPTLDLQPSPQETESRTAGPAYADQAVETARRNRQQAQFEAALARVGRATEALRVELEAHAEYGRQALAYLDSTIREAHGYPELLEYAVPALVLDEDLYDAGARIVHNALDPEPDEHTDDQPDDAQPAGDDRETAA